MNVSSDSSYSQSRNDDSKIRNDDSQSESGSSSSDDDSKIRNDDSKSESGSSSSDDDSKIRNDDSNSESGSSSSDDDLPLARRKQTNRIILSSSSEEECDEKLNVVSDKSTASINSSSEVSHNSNTDCLTSSGNNTNKQNSTINSEGDTTRMLPNKKYSSTPSTSTTSNSLGSFVDSNLFGDESDRNSSVRELRERKRSEKSSASLLAKSFTKYRSTIDSLSSDEEEENENVQKNQTTPKARKSRSVYREREDTARPSEVVVPDSDDEQFEAEFEKNVYSPRTRMSITGVRAASFLSDSDDEVVIQAERDTFEGDKPIEIPDSDTENETIPVENSDVNLSNVYLDQKLLNVSGLKKPLQASSPLPKPMLQPKLTKLATYVSQEFFDKQVMKLNDMENELQKSIQLRGAFQIKLPDDGRRLSGRIDRLKQDIEQQQQYIKTLEVQTSFSQNEIKPIPKPAPPTKIIELSWDALDAATNEVKPKYTGTVGLNTFNTQKALTLDSLKDIHESISSCPAPDKFAEDPPGLKVELMPHQKHALLWLAWRETQRPRGGILADDMGLGKTLTVIAHVLAEYYRKENCSEEEEESRDNQNPHDGWTAKGRKDQYSGGTLVVCPASLIGQWEYEIKNKLKRGILTYVVHHGTKRDVKARHLAKADVVITTYNIVSRECIGDNRCGPLADIKWNRVVLDEAHVIRNHKTRMSESVSSLSRRSSWILTGTPIQNKEMDIYALLRFLKCRPFDDLSHFKKWIDNKNAGGQLRMNTILKAILLRRTKVELISAGGLLTMPAKVVRLVKVILERDEMNVYQKIMLYSQTLFAQYLHQRADKCDGIDYNYKPASKPNDAYHKAHKMLVQMHSGNRDVKSHEILVLLLRLRQICVHPGLITAMLEDDDKSAVYDDSTSEQDSVDIDLMEQLNQLNINENDDAASFELPQNDSRMAKASQKVLLKTNPVFDLSRPSSKFLKLLEILKKDILPKNENAVIVSQWTSVLEIIGMTLRREGISYTSLTGSVPVKDRGAIVERFNNKSQHSKILLLSLSAGGVGLNLVGGNHLLLIDLHWNPQLEAQAQDRVYRVGQTKPVTIYKFVSTNTIEERIKKLQDKKLEIANGVLTGTSTKGSKLSIDDLKSLFDL